MKNILLRISVVILISFAGFITTIGGCGGGEESPDGGGGTPSQPPQPSQPSQPSGVLYYDNLPPPDSRLSQFKVKSRWQKDNLTYFIANFTADIDQQSQRQIFSKAFSAWSSVTPLSITEVSSASQADFIIGFGTGNHCELYRIINEQCSGNTAFDGPNGILAHCYFPNRDLLSGDAHFDDAELWQATSNPGGISLLDVAIHELGHGFGLDHSEDQSAIMYASYDSNNIKTTLRADDIAGIQELYGSSDGGAVPRQPSPPPDTPPTVSPCGPTSPTDNDGDGVDNNTEKFVVGTNPNNCDTDGDGLSDAEVYYGLNPLNPDTDGDGVSDGNEVLNGTDPYVPDQGNAGAGVVGTYTGQDSFGSPLSVRINSDGSATGALRIVYFGVFTDIYFVGGIDVNGTLVLVSYDYFYAYFASIGNGILQGQFETTGGAVGTWYASRVSGFSTQSVKSEVTPTVSSDAYQPVRGKRQPTTHPVHYRVTW